MQLKDEILNIKSSIEEEDKKINSFINYTSDNNLIRQSIKNSNSLDYKNFLIAVKDNIAVEELPLTAASQVLSSFSNPLYTATCVNRLFESGAINIGKLNMDEFAMGSSTTTSYFGATKNPYNLDVVPGGSSGGSAAAVACNFVDAALGTDTGGSIRQPASFTNNVGFKPTYGRISRNGIISFSSTLDHVGIITRTINDNVKVLSTIAGPDKLDLTCCREKFLKEDVNSSKIKYKKIAVLEQVKCNFNDPQVSEVFNKALTVFKNNGFEIDFISVEYFEYINSIYDIISNIEAFSSLCRYDGIRYGYRCNRSFDTTLEEFYIENRNVFGQTVKNRITLGKYLLIKDNNIYFKALQLRNKLFINLLKLFSEYDIIATPTSPILPFNMDRISKKELKVADTYTMLPNLVGMPAISVPFGFAEENLPIGVQLISKPFSEGMLFYIAKILENSNKRTNIRPDIFLKR